MFDMQRKPKKAMRKMALYKLGSDRVSHETEILYKVCRSKIPLGVALKGELMVMLRKYLLTEGCEIEENPNYRA